MNQSDIKVIFLQELRDLMKEKTIIFLTVVLPIIIYPLILGGVNTLMSTQLKKLEQETMKIVISGAGDWFVPFLEKSGKPFTIVKNISRPEQALEEKQIQLWLEFGPLSPENTGFVMVHFSTVNESSRQAVETIEEILAEAKDELIRTGFLKQGLHIKTNDVLQTELVDISSDRKKSGYLAGKIVPILMILMILSGASFAAVDLISGEKERGTLETLLLAPVSRESIIWGKFLVVLFIATISAIINLLGIYLTLALGMMKIPFMENVTFNLGLFDLVLILLFTLPMSVLFSSLLMIIASYADTFKEGQYYVLPFILFGIIPGIPALLPNIELTTFLCLVPVTSLALAIREILAGTYHVTALGIAFVSNCVFAFICLKIAAHTLDRETILPGSKSVSPFRSEQFLKQGIMLFGLVFLLIYFVGSTIQQQHLIIGLWLTQLLLIAAPALLFVRLNKLPYANFLRLKPFNTRELSGALMFEIGILTALPWIMAIQNRFIPAPQNFYEQFSDSLFNVDFPLWVIVLTFGLSAGICEELLFRGTLTGAFSRSLKQWQVIILVGFLFGLVHFNVYRLVPTAFIGIVYTLVRLKSGSLYLPMILHTAHNMLLTSLSRQDDTLLPALNSEFETVPALIVSLGLFVLGWILLNSKTTSKHNA